MQEASHSMDWGMILENQSVNRSLSFNKGLVPMLQGGLPGSLLIFELMDPKGMMGDAKRFNNQVNTLS